MNGKLVWWIVGLQGTALLGFLTFGLAQYSATQEQLTELRVSHAQLREGVQALRDRVLATAAEQEARRTWFAGIHDRFTAHSDRIQSIDNRLTRMGEGYDAMSKRVLSLTERLDSVQSSSGK